MASVFLPSELQMSRDALTGGSDKGKIAFLSTPLSELHPVLPFPLIPIPTQSVSFPV